MNEFFIEDIQMEDLEMHEAIDWLYSLFEFQFNIDNNNYDKYIRNTIVEVLKELYIEFRYILNIHELIADFIVSYQDTVLNLLESLNNNLINTNTYYTRFRENFILLKDKDINN